MSKGNHRPGCLYYPFIGCTCGYEGKTKMVVSKYPPSEKFLTILRTLVLLVLLLILFACGLIGLAMVIKELTGAVS